MSRKEFLNCSPREFDALTERLRTLREDARYNAAMVVAAIYTVNRDPDKRPEGFTPEDILGKKTPGRQTLEEFALECERNGSLRLGVKSDSYNLIPREEDNELADEFLANLKKEFKPIDNPNVRLVKK